MELGAAPCACLAGRNESVALGYGLRRIRKVLTAEQTHVYVGQSP